ncbi:MAG: Ig-like domain-containing protein, partial [Candidatus Limnocylindrales bacterium]
NVVSFTAAGACKIDANQPASGDGNWNAAAQAQQSFTVGKGTPTINFTSTASSPVVGGSTYNVTASDSSPATITFTIDATASSVCSISGGNVVSFTAAGACKIDANQPASGDGNWNAAAQAQQSFTVGKGNCYRDLGPARDLLDRLHRQLGLLYLRRPGQLPDRRYLQDRRQPGRQHQLERGCPGPAVLPGCIRPRCADRRHRRRIRRIRSR